MAGSGASGTGMMSGDSRPDSKIEGGGGGAGSGGTTWKPGDPIRKGSPLEIGPVMTLPGWYLLLAALAGVVVVCAGAYGAALLVRPDAASAAWLAALAAGPAHGAGVLLVRPWKKRWLGQWPFAVLGGSVASIGGVLILLVLLYSATRPDTVWFVLVAALAWTVGLFAEVGAYARIIRMRTAS